MLCLISVVVYLGPCYADCAECNVYSLLLLTYPLYQRLARVGVAVSMFLKSFVKGLLRKKGYVIHRSSGMHYLVPMLQDYLDRNSSLFFVQVGANDGVRSDPLYDFVHDNKDKVSGIVLEPIKEYFDRLVENYKGCNGVIPVNKAIHCTDSEAVMYMVNSKKRDGLPAHYGGITSFNKDHHKRSRIPEECMEEVVVECVTIDGLLAEHGVDHIDLLQVDAEGYDYDIIMGIDFSSVRPSVLRFECGLRGNTMTKPRLLEVLARLRENGYDIMMEQRDVTAYQLERFL